MNAHATQELIGFELMARSFSSLAPAVCELGLAESLTCEADGLGLPCFETFPLVWINMTVRAARGAGIEHLAVEPALGLEKLVAAILANDRESRFPVVWHDGWPFVAGCGAATIAGGAGESIPCPKSETGGV